MINYQDRHLYVSRFGDSTDAAKTGTYESKARLFLNDKWIDVTISGEIKIFGSIGQRAGIDIDTVHQLGIWGEFSLPEHDQQVFGLNLAGPASNVPTKAGVSGRIENFPLWLTCYPHPYETESDFRPLDQQIAGSLVWDSSSNRSQDGKYQEFTTSFGLDVENQNGPIKGLHIATPELFRVCYLIRTVSVKYAVVGDFPDDDQGLINEVFAPYVESLSPALEDRGLRLQPHPEMLRSIPSGEPNLAFDEGDVPLVLIDPNLDEIELPQEALVLSEATDSEAVVNALTDTATDTDAPQETPSICSIPALIEIRCRYVAVNRNASEIQGLAAWLNPWLTALNSLWTVVAGIRLTPVGNGTLVATNHGNIPVTAKTLNDPLNQKIGNNNYTDHKAKNVDTWAERSGRLTIYLVPGLHQDRNGGVTYGEFSAAPYLVLQVDQATRNTPALMSHELGHIFGLKHPDEWDVCANFNLKSWRSVAGSIGQPIPLGSNAIRSITENEFYAVRRPAVIGLLAPIAEGCTQQANLTLAKSLTLELDWDFWLAPDVPAAGYDECAPMSWNYKNGNGDMIVDRTKSEFRVSAGQMHYIYVRLHRYHLKKIAEGERVWVFFYLVPATGNPQRVPSANPQPWAYYADDARLLAVIQNVSNIRNFYANTYAWNPTKTAVQLFNNWFGTRSLPWTVPLAAIDGMLFAVIVPLRPNNGIEIMAPMANPATSARLQKVRDGTATLADLEALRSNTIYARRIQIKSPLA